MKMMKPLLLSQDSLSDLMKIAKSTVVMEAFEFLDLGESLNNYLRQNYKKRVYYANIPDSVSGITIFGGMILIHPKWRDDTPVSQCGLKVVFLHELAHAVRKEYTPGFYDIGIRTPDRKGPFYKGAPGKINEKYKKKTENLGEGGILLETTLFSVFLSKLSLRQINYLNCALNWKKSLNLFKDELKNEYHEYDGVYHFARGLNCSINLERIGHDCL